MRTISGSLHTRRYRYLEHALGGPGPRSTVLVFSPWFCWHRSERRLPEPLRTRQHPPRFQNVAGPVQDGEEGAMVPIAACGCHDMLSKAGISRRGLLRALGVAGVAATLPLKAG